LLYSGKKHGGWEDDEMDEYCRTFLKLVGDISDCNLASFPHPKALSSAIDLVAQLALELNSDEKVWRALEMRKSLNDLHEVSALEQFKSSSFLKRIFLWIYNPDRWSWSTLAKWVGLHEFLRDRLEVCDIIAQEARSRVYRARCVISETLISGRSN
jgi:hypothetical protein